MPRSVPSPSWAAPRAVTPTGCEKRSRTRTPAGLSIYPPFPSRTREIVLLSAPGGVEPRGSREPASLLVDYLVGASRARGTFMIARAELRRPEERPLRGTRAPRRALALVVIRRRQTRLLAIDTCRGGPDNDERDGGDGDGHRDDVRIRRIRPKRRVSVVLARTRGMTSYPRGLEETRPCGCACWCERDRLMREG